VIEIVSLPLIEVLNEGIAAVIVMEILAVLMQVTRQEKEKGMETTSERLI
jgi:hypothetical protein